MISNYTKLNDLVSKSTSILILQADNPDGDSLASSLALEAIFSEMGKSVYMACSVDMPSYLRFLDGWDRVVKEIPSDFDLSIIVDTNTESLFENFGRNGSLQWIKAKPCIVIDHHVQSDGISYADLIISETAVATSEITYRIAQNNKWPLPLDACEMMASSIMSDSVGLISDATTSESIHIMAELVSRGVSLAKIDDKRRALMKRQPILLDYKGKLLQRIHLSQDGQVASVSIPWDEIERYSPMYNPTMLVMDDMRMTIGVAVAVGYKIYKDGKITAKIRCNYGNGIASDLAEKFGGGGHEYAAGFKIRQQRNFAGLRSEVNREATELLEKLKRSNHEVI